MFRGLCQYLRAMCGEQFSHLCCAVLLDALLLDLVVAGVWEGVFGSRSGRKVRPHRYTAAPFNTYLDPTRQLTYGALLG